MGVEIGIGTGVVIVRTGAIERYEPGDSVDTTGSRCLLIGTFPV